MGETVGYRGEREPARNTLSRFKGKFAIRQVTPADWDAIGGLYRHATLTRFSRDPRIGREGAHRHKLACLREYGKRAADYFLIAEASGGRPVGFLGCLETPGQFDIYESVVHPDYRTGFVLADLLREGLSRFAMLQPATDRIVTRIYADNSTARAYYEKLGFRVTSIDYWYHLWTSTR